MPSRKLSIAASVATIIAALIAVFTFFNFSPAPPENTGNPIHNLEPRACTESDYVQVGWIRDDVVSETSGWVGGGSNPTNWCNALINKTLQARGIGADHEVEVIKKSEEGRWTGIFGRDRQYNYFCQIRIRWEPKMEVKPTANCE